MGHGTPLGVLGGGQVVNLTVLVDTFLNAVDVAGNDTCILATFLLWFVGVYSDTLPC